MNERDRLIELIQGAKKHTKGACSDLERTMIFADHLLTNGVIVPPVKLGQKVYLVLYDIYGIALVRYECEVAKIEVRHTGMTFTCMGGFVFGLEHLGDTVFLTREEAEQALAERNNQS